MSASLTSSRQSPNRKTPTRAPLQEVSRSQANEISARIARDVRADPGFQNVYYASPFPTKAAHVLLPSSLKKQRLGADSQTRFPDFLVPSRTASATSAISAHDTAELGRSRKQPALKLKRSVKTLRDLYEAQEDNSRPSTATSPALRPTSSSSRLRSYSSGEGITGRSGWDLLSKISSDDLALLPTLDQANRSLKNLPSQSSFASRAGKAGTAGLYDDLPQSKIPVYCDQDQITSDVVSPTSESAWLASDLPGQDRNENNPRQKLGFATYDMESSSPIHRTIGCSSSPVVRPFEYQSNPVLSTVEELESHTSESLPGTSSPVWMPANSASDMTPDSANTSRISNRGPAGLTSSVDASSTRSTSSPTWKSIVGTSSPNYREIESSSPAWRAFAPHPGPCTEPADLESSPQTIHATSSPNVMRLGRSSSIDETVTTEHSSSPNLVQLGDSSSPIDDPTEPSSISLAESSASVTRKRKRAGTTGNRSYAARLGATNPYPSSPPYEPSVSSSGPNLPSPRAQDTPTPASAIASSPVFRVLAPDTSSDDSSVVQTHDSLQEALSSSPSHPIQYPIVRAPAVSQFAGLSIPKRSSDSGLLDGRWASRLSTVPSEWSGSHSRPGSKQSSLEDDGDDIQSNSSAILAAAVDENNTNESQIRIILDAEHHEASDEVSALPGGQYSLRCPPTRPARSSSYLGTTQGQSQSRLSTLRTSMDQGLSTIKSLGHSRQSSSRSSPRRPGSSGSVVSTVTIPAWARRYYSGVYRQSNHSGVVSTSQFNSSVNLSVPTLPSSPKSRASRPSFQSFRNSFNEHIQNLPTIFRPRSRPKIEARKSHVMPGIGPLVSNPVCGPATAAINSHRQPCVSAQSTIRPVSLPLHPADPRAHWAGVVQRASVDDMNAPFNRDHRRTSSDSELPYNRAYYGHGRHGRMASASPHLHQDRRLNTGSSASRGYGFPFNRRSRWSAPRISVNRSLPASGSRTTKLRKTQILLFAAGFVVPLCWFAAAFLPLPNRPETFADVEKAEWNAYHKNLRHSTDVTDWEEMDIVAKLRLERHLNGIEEVQWQNARWWRNLNRWMCAVGVLVLVIIIVLAALSTKGRF